MTVKQKRLQSAFILLSRAALCAALCLFGTGAGRAQTSTSDLDQTRLELLDGGGKDGIYVAGIAIAMAPGSHTYWKMPGDAGVPPVFDFAGSQNVRSVHVRYPVPRRISEEGLDAFGYLDDVTFPVDVAAVDPAKPVELKAKVVYAVCNKICIPAMGHASLTLEPGAGPGRSTRIAGALAEVPAQASPQERIGLSVVREAAAAKPTWTLAWRGAAPIDDIFADTPDGTYFATRKTGPGTWRLVAEQLPPDATSVPVALTLARNMHPLVVEERLDTAAATR